ncbi:MAG: hypothetical protein ACI8UO_001915 [Verrucomicrobiales bacterium]|jgi:hypothetical protein
MRRNEITMISKLLSTICLAALLLAGPSAMAQPIDHIALRHEPTLNNVIRWVPVHSRRADEDLALLSALWEQVTLHERRMRGEGLPAEQGALLSANYSAILDALIDERITEEHGRELLLNHRELVEKTRHWSSKKAPDPETEGVLAKELKKGDSKLADYAKLRSAIPDSARTPIINGHQIWIEELLVWGCHCKSLSPGDQGRLKVANSRLERDERDSKRDGVLTQQERERLHRRLIDMQRLLTEVLES